MHNTQVNLQKVQRSASSIFPRLFVLWLHLLVCIMDVSNPKTRKSQQESKKHQKAKGIMSSLLNLHCSKILLFPFFFGQSSILFNGGKHHVFDGYHPVLKIPKEKVLMWTHPSGKGVQFLGVWKGKPDFFLLGKGSETAKMFYGCLISCEQWKKPGLVWLYWRLYYPAL